MGLQNIVQIGNRLSRLRAALSKMRIYTQQFHQIIAQRITALKEVVHVS
jgi:hypothetical protein